MSDSCMINAFYLRCILCLAVFEAAVKSTKKPECGLEMLNTVKKKNKKKLFTHFVIYFVNTNFLQACPLLSIYQVFLKPICILLFMIVTVYAKSVSGRFTLSTCSLDAIRLGSSVCFILSCDQASNMWCKESVIIYKVLECVLFVSLCLCLVIMLPVLTKKKSLFTLKGTIK